MRPTSAAYPKYTPGPAAPQPQVQQRVYQKKALEEDKESLKKRLNMVLGELDKITDEKSELDRQMTTQLQLGEELDEKIAKSDNLSRVLNKNLQDDLKYEKELNSKLREEITRYESQKSQLFEQLKEEQQLCEQYSEDIKNCHQTLALREEQMSDIAALHQRNKEKIGELSNELEELKTKLMEQAQEKDSLVSEVSNLENERNSLVARMNELTGKYETYVKSIGEEKDKMRLRQKDLVAGLSFRIAWRKLEIFVKRRKNVAMTMLLENLHGESFKGHMVARMEAILGDYYLRRKKAAWMIWQQKLLNWPKERSRRDILIDLCNLDKTIIQNFKRWLLLAQASQKHRADRRMAAARVCRIVQNCCTRLTGDTWAFFKALFKHSIKKAGALSNVVSAKNQKQLRLAFEQLRLHMRQVRKRLTLEYLMNTLANSQMLRITFSRFLDGIRQSKFDKLLYIYRGFRFWKNAKRKEMQTKSAAVIAMKMEKAKERNILKRVLLQLQNNKAEEKLNRLSGSLAEENEKHQQLTEDSKKNKEDIKKSLRRHSIKVFIKSLKDRMYPFFSYWRLISQRQKQHEVRLIPLWYLAYRQKIKSYYQKWRQFVNQSRFHLLNTSLHKAYEDIRIKQDEIVGKNKTTKERSAAVNEKQKAKVSRAADILNRNWMRFGINKWRVASANMRTCEKVIDKCFLTRIRKRKLFLAFSQYRQQAGLMKEAEIQEKKVAAISQERLQRQLRILWQRLKMHKVKRKIAKQKIKNGIKKAMRIDKGHCFHQWLRNIRKGEIASEKISGEEKYAEQRELKGQQQALAESCEKADKILEALTKRHLTQTTRIVWNLVFSQRGILDKRTALLRWYKLIFTAKAKTASFYGSLSVLRRAILKNAYTKWKTVNREKSRQAKVEFTKNEITKMKVKKQQMKNDILQKEEEKKGMQKELNDMTGSQKQSANIKENIQNKLVKTRENTVFYSLKQKILKGWREIAYKEKRMAEKLLDISVRHIKEYILIKIKNASLEEKELHEKLFHRRKVGMINVKSRLKVAMDLWRNRNYFARRLEAQEDAEEKTKEIAQQVEKVRELNKTLYKNASCILKTKHKNQVLHEAAKIVNHLQENKRKVEEHLKKRKIVFLKHRFNNWKQFTLSSQLKHLRKMKALKHYNKGIEKKWLLQLRKVAKTHQRLPKKLSELERLRTLNSAIKSQEVLRRHLLAETQAAKFRRTLGTTLLLTKLQQITRIRILSHLTLMSSKAAIVKTRSTKLGTCIVAIFLSRLRKCFNRLRSDTAHKTLAQSIHISGDQATECERMRSQITAIEQLLETQGFAKPQLEATVTEMMGQKKALIQKALGRWKAYNTPELDLCSLLDSWRNHAKHKNFMRDKLGKLASFLGNRDLYKGFLRWRKYHKKAKEYFFGKNKDDLVEEALRAGKENAIRAIEVQRMNQEIAHGEAVVEALGKKKFTSKGLSLHIIKALFKDAKSSAFSRWMTVNRREKMRNITNEIQNKTSTISDIHDGNKQLETTCRTLEVENEDLRGLSLESVDLAKAMKELNKQKEQLSVDLADRASTILKLLEDNKVLNEKLSAAQNEAKSGLGTMLS